MPYLNYIVIGSFLALGALTGYQKISILGLEKDLIVVEQQKQRWKESDVKLRAKLGEVETSAKQANDLNNEYLKTVREMQVEYTELQKELRDANQQTEELSRIFAEHDFEYLLKAKPGLMQRRIRRGSQRLFERFRPERDPSSTPSDNN